MLSPKIKALLGQLLFAANVFVLFLVVAENRVMIPDWLHVFGRLHPLLLHFPIVLLMIAVALLALPGLLKTREDSKDYGTDLLLLGALTAAFTVIAGLLLSHETGYDQNALLWHKWTGLTVFWLSSLLYYFIEKSTQKVLQISSGLVAVVVVVSGHLGASITHGEDFITAPFMGNDMVNVSLEEAEVFEHVIMPILKNKCISCHKASKQKGELRMDSPEYLLEGGESGPAVIPFDPEGSLLIEKIHLPLEDEEHMPPEGKPQLSEEEMAILEAWIVAGAEFEKKVTDLSDTTGIYALAVNKFKSAPKIYDFKEADAQTLEKLNNFYRKIQPLGLESPALSASYFGRASFKPESLQELQEISLQLVSLNLNNMPVKDEDLEYLKPFENLEKLFLNFADISGEGLQHLIGLENLTYLSISGNPLDEKALEQLANMKQLRQLFIWNTGLEQNALDQLKQDLPNVEIETGYRDDGTVFTLNPPVIQFDKAFFSEKMELKIEHPIQGTSIFYTLDGSEPDSSNYLLYEGPFEIEENLTLKARAFAEGWTGSATETAEFIRSEISPKDYEMKFNPEDRYKGDGPKSLFDRYKAIPDVWNLNWLGFQNNPLDVEMEFENPTEINHMALSIWHNVGASFFPPEEVEIWVQKEGQDWGLAKKYRPTPPKKDDKAHLRQMDIPFTASGITKMRIVANPVPSLPAWHGGAGRKGWLMVDELVLN
ncbi:MAG: c-type cytochrome domain-containing protein [Cyclobacteriaceae bacterium]